MDGGRWLKEEIELAKFGKALVVPLIYLNVTRYI